MTAAWFRDGKVYKHYIELGQGYDDIAAQIINNTPELVMHNAKFDVQKLALAGLVDPDDLRGRLHDTQALAHLLDEHRRLALKGLARDYLGLQTVEETAIKEWFQKQKIKKADWDYSKLPRELLIPYAEMDVEYTIRLWRALYPPVMADTELTFMYDEIEMPLTFVLLDMEAQGLKLDLTYLEDTARKYAKQSLALELGLREMAGDDEFNPNSPKQVLEVLSSRGIKVESSNKDTLKGVDDAFARDLLDLRSTRKVHGSYLVPLLAEHRFGVVHPWTRQHSTRTGRMSSGATEA